MRTRTTTLWCGVALGGWMIGAANVAEATDHGFYAGVDGGVGSYSHDVQVKVVTGPTLFDGPTYKTENSHSTGFAWSFAAGYRFNRYFAAELGFSDLGQATANLVTDPDTNAAKGRVQMSARGKSLALLGHLPTGNWDSYLKVGVIQAIFDRTPTEQLDGMELHVGSIHQRGVRGLFGVGTRYAFTEQWAMSFALDFYPNVDGSSGSGDILSPRVGFAYRF